MNLELGMEKFLMELRRVKKQNMNRLVLSFLLFNLAIKSFGQTKNYDNCSDSLAWKDSEGFKILKIRIIKKGERGTKKWVDRIAADFFLKNGDSLIEVNRIRESANTMSVISYVNNSLKLIDLDNDGTDESYFFYEVEQDGLDDNQLKLVCFYRKSKIVILGNVPKQSERKDKIKYASKGTENIPELIINWLVKEWNNEAHKRMEKYISELE